MSKFNRLILFTSYAYIFLPVLLFIVLWLKPVFSVVLGILLLIGFYYSYRNDSLSWIDKDIDKKKAILFLALVFIIIVVLTSGIGASVFQYSEQQANNSIFKLLIDNAWPVKMAGNGGGTILVSDIGFFLPAALIGKFTSYQFGLLFQQLWAVIGLFLVWYFICEKKEKISLLYLGIFLIFGGADYLGILLSGTDVSELSCHYERWAGSIYYPGTLTSLFLFYNEAIYGWLIYRMIMRQSDNKNLIIVWSMSLLSSTYAGFGMIPFVIYKMFINSDIRKNSVVNALRSLFSIQNIIGIIIAFITLSYLIPGISSTSDVSMSTPSLIVSHGTIIRFENYHWTSDLYVYLWVILLEFCLYHVCLYKNRYHDPLYWLCLITLMICPLIKIDDFCMKASIPALLCEYEMVMSALEDYHANKDHVRFGCLIILLLISCVSCYDVLLGVMEPTNVDLFTDTYPATLLGDIDKLMIHSDNLFFRYLIK